MHIEDIDLNAAIGQIAAAKSQLNCFLKDADTIELPQEEGMWIKRIMTTDETAGGKGGYSEFLGRGSERKFYWGKLVEIGDHLINVIEMIDNALQIPKGQRIKAFGNLSGSGAEQHVVIHDIYMPSLESVPINHGPFKHVHMLGAMTGTLVAATITGLNSLLGDETALQDSEIQFSEDGKYCLIGFWATPGGAGYGALGFRHPNGKFDRLSPASFTQVTVPPFVPLYWEFEGTSPPRVIGAGVGTTSTELTFLLGEL